MDSLIFFEYLYLEKGSLLSEAYFTGFGAKNQFIKIIPYFILFLLLQLTHSHWNFENPWSLQGSEAKRRFCLHLGQASTSRPVGTIMCLGDKICGSSNIVHRRWPRHFDQERNTFWSSPLLLSDSLDKTWWAVGKLKGEYKLWENPSQADHGRCSNCNLLMSSRSHDKWFDWQHLYGML